MKNYILIITCLLLFSFSNAQNDKSGFAEVNGTKLYYELKGSGDCIVFIHGNIGDCRHWDKQFDFLQKNIRFCDMMFEVMANQPCH